ncbi:hypothetical protein HMPREF9294_0148 [Porphyromonas asaccharolytica PR426713P-I]|nr:hypothetical protein HMPREF9294_0148 [Porphyromonas asaccharolytica PR426713P-I]
MGCDRRLHQLIWREGGFNSRTPCGVRPIDNHVLSVTYKFQFTHPVRGATACRISSCTSYLVSIHAPRAGCDLYLFRGGGRRHRFQFTHPVRDAILRSPGYSYTLSGFNSRTPCGVRLLVCRCLVRSISFNSRTPCGVRQLRKYIGNVMYVFQFTHPVRGATHAEVVPCGYARVSIHAPRAGCDLLDLFILFGLQSFNSRTPCGVRHTLVLGSPRARRFNSRTPCGVRQQSCIIVRQSTEVSIHAPRAGCDTKGDQKHSNSYKFQFTHPVRGAT